ncbi:MAG: PLP-dependent lyase/thiolase [bacterium]|nr:PLP-dependent lyase/thiolase [bacterium]
MVTPNESSPELAQVLGISSVFFKREDLHPYGSHKGRSIPLMIDMKVKEGCDHFAISSSGNAALAAGLHIKNLNEKRENKITLEILAGKNIDPDKLRKLENISDSHILLSIQDRPLQALFMKTQDHSVQSLRQSQDETALDGYASLAEELLEIPDLKAVFMGTSSGTTAQALAKYFIENKKEIEIHIVQTTSCHPMADAFVENDGRDEKSIADAIVDSVAARKDALIPLIKESGGSGWIVSNEEIISAMDLSKKHAGSGISPNSALSLAGLMQAAYTGKTWSGPAVCMICGD